MFGEKNGALINEFTIKKRRDYYNKCDKGNSLFDPAAHQKA